MWIEYRARGTWASINDRVAEALGLSGVGFEFRVYPNVSAALIECGVGLRRLFPLKKKVFYFEHMSPLFAPLLMWLAKEGLELHAWPLSSLQDATQFAAQMAHVDRETLLVLYAEDDPVFAEQFETAKLESDMKAKGVMRVVTTHAAHRVSGLPGAVDRNEIRIYSGGKFGALVLLGDRGRVGPLVAEHVVKASTEGDIADLKAYLGLGKRASELKSQIEKFENSGIAASMALMRGKPRVYDRAILSWTDMDGHAVVDRLAKKLGLTIAPEPGTDPVIETLSLSRWGGVKTFEFYTGKGIDPKALRGTVILSPDILSSKLAETLVDVRKSILEDQFGH